MHIDEKKFLRFLRTKWFIPVFLGIIFLPAAFLFFYVSGQGVPA